MLGFDFGKQMGISASCFIEQAFFPCAESERKRKQERYNEMMRDMSRPMAF